MNGSLSSRVALFGKAWAGISLLGVAFHAAATTLLGSSGELLHLPFALHALTCLIPLSVWAACRVPRSDFVCRAIEGAGLVAGAAAMAFMGRALALQVTPDRAGAPEDVYALLAGNIYESFATLVIFASSMTLTLRSALVPSPMLHTVWLGVAMGAAKIAVFTLGYPSLPGLGGPPRAGLAVSMGSSWLVAVAACATLSAVIYGLHREIQKARKLGQYTLEEKIGEGGMGVVYRASHAMLRRPTAVKLLRSERAGDEIIKRFEREVQRTAELTHPNTVTVYDYGRTPDGVFYYAMELLGGETLQAVVDASGPQPPARVVHVLRMVAGALAEAHGRGLIHRDVKPANIVLGERGGMPDVATVLDFGLVRELEGGSVDAGITSDEKIIGTPMYLAPEVIKAADAADARSDLYALGAVAYFMLTGHTVFDGKSVVEVCGHHLHSPVEPPSVRLGASVPPDLEALVMRSLAKDPSERPQSAHAFADALAALDTPPWSADDARSWRDARRRPPEPKLEG